MSSPRRLTWSWVAGELPVVIPPLAWGVLGWHRRWLTDDGLIAARTVRQILAGNGPVFNAGERVEANTSALWTWLLAAISFVSRLDVYTVMIWAGLLLAPLGLLFALLGSRELHRRHAPGRLMLPVGAAIVLAVPPFWDFVTAGLEDSLIFCWLGLCWLLLAGLRPDSRRRAGWLAFTAGLGWLVRPDMAIGTVLFLAALWFIVRPGWRQALRLAAIAGAVPAAYQVFRMGYYGLLVPNTAVAKDASSLHASQGLVYLTNFVVPYKLWIPVLVLLVLFPLTVGQRMSRDDLIRCAAAVGSGVLMVAYVVAIGGDFMHARMLLPGTFALLLPVMMLPAPKPSLAAMRIAAPAALCIVAIGAWAVACGIGFRLYQKVDYVPKSGIDDERTYWALGIHQPNPDTAAKYVDSLMGTPSAAGSPEWLITTAAGSGKPTLLYKVSKHEFVSVPTGQPRYPVVVVEYILGTFGAGTPLNGLVVDQRGLSYALGAHTTAGPNGRPGHAIFVSPAWAIAEYSNATRAPGISSADIAAARKALSCGELAGLNQATQAPMTPGRFISNFFHSFSLTTFRFSPDPQVAEHQLCGH